MTRMLGILVLVLAVLVGFAIGVGFSLTVILARSAH